MKKYVQQCAYWSALTCKCGKSEGGVFIPMDDHIESYCLSKNCYSCPQLQSSEQEPEESARWRNRRKAERIYARETLMLNTHLPPIYPDDFHSFQRTNPATFSHIEKFPAETIDISTSGMRLFADMPLSQHSLVEISFGKKFPKQLRRAKGKVQWCNKQIDEPGYQMGIAFAENQTGRAMEGFLQERFIA